MPLYEYQCAGCGVFEAATPMAAATAPSPCPSCGTLAARILSASAVMAGGGKGQRRRRGRPEPRLVERTLDAPPPAAQPSRAVAHGRPWMLGH